MPSGHTLRGLFSRPIDRRIEEVIKVDQTDEDILADEIEEYETTAAIAKHYCEILERYQETPNKPHEGIAVWVSGFFGSGKSSFTKMLGLSVGNRLVRGESAAVRFAQRASNPKLQVLLQTINESIPTHAVIFDVSTDRGIRSGNQTLTEIMYGLFLQSLGYAKDLDLSELEIGLEEQGRLAAFQDTYRDLFDGKVWDNEKGKVAFALSEASRVLHTLEPATYPMADSWVKAVKGKADITPGKLAERATELMRRRRPGHSLMFVIDEVGQFVARDVQKMLDLAAVVQSLGVKGRGKHWLVVTSQEKLGELISGLDDKKIELHRLMDRFPLQVHLEPSDISEVTSRRVLSKNAAAETELGLLFDQHRARLTEHTRLTADIRLPDLTREGFIDLYPLLPYQIDLIIQVVSGLRTQGGGGAHVGGANRTIIKLAQQLLINPAVKLADEPIGTLARLDQVYDLVENNIGSDVRAKISAIGRDLKHPLAQRVAKVICLLQFVKSVHRTAENFAAALYPSVGADSRLADVKEALNELEATHQVRRGEDGYRIPTPAEDDWERSRNAVNPKPGDTHRLCSEVLQGFWQPAPSHTFLDTKTFKAGLTIHGREVTPGDLAFHFQLADKPEEFPALAAELRIRSRQEPKVVFWAVQLGAAIDRQMVELFRSREILARRGREARGEDTPALIAEEGLRQRRHQEELRRLLKAACLSGSVYFRGSDRPPGDGALEVSKSAADILSKVLPEVFDRFREAAAKPADVKKGVDALFIAESLQGLPPVFTTLELLRSEQGRTVFRTDSGPLKELLNRIEERANYGDTASGRLLVDEFAREPFGWDLEAVRLLILALLRAGKIEAISKSQTLEATTTVEARETFSNNNLFRQASFRPKRGIEFEELVKAAEAYQETFGAEVRELSAGTIVEELRREIARHEDGVSAVLAKLTAHRLPGSAALESALGQMKAILRGTEDQALATFNTSFRAMKDALKRAGELEQALSEPRLHSLDQARRAISWAWPVLQHEVGLNPDLASRAEQLDDLLRRETFYRDLPTIEQHARAIELEYSRRFDDAQQARVDSYRRSLDQLAQTPGWHDLPEEVRNDIAAPLRARTEPLPRTDPLPLLRSERDACESRLRQAIRRVQEVLEGERLAAVQAQPYFGGGVETEEQLDAALQGLRDECLHLIGAGKKVVLT